MVFIKVAVSPYVEGTVSNQYRIIRAKLSEVIDMNNVRYIIIDHETIGLFDEIASSPINIPIMISISSSYQEEHAEEFKRFRRKVMSGVGICKKTGKFVKRIYVK
jgi:hypothetical protein